VIGLVAIVMVTRGPLLAWRRARTGAGAGSFMTIGWSSRLVGGIRLAVVAMMTAPLLVRRRARTGSIRLVVVATMMAPLLGHRRARSTMPRGIYGVQVWIVYNLTDSRSGYGKIVWSRFVSWLLICL
jgi:bacteriorhodopsin